HSLPCRNVCRSVSYHIIPTCLYVGTKNVWILATADMLCICVKYYSGVIRSNFSGKKRESTLLLMYAVTCKYTMKRDFLMELIISRIYKSLKETASLIVFEERLQQLTYETFTHADCHE